VGKKPELVVIAGPNGSGKTSITEQLLRHTWTERCCYINPDLIAETEFGGWDGRENFLKAAQKAESMRRECLRDLRSLAFETVFSTSEKVEFLRDAMAAGYFIRLFFVCTDSPEINGRRVAQRVREGGHTVPNDKIVSRYAKSVANGAVAIKFVDRAYIYDNSMEDAPPSLLFRAMSGTLEKVYREPLNEWARPIFAALRVP
jgi:predicted ABC-type ATPase